MTLSSAALLLIVDDTEALQSAWLLVRSARASSPAQMLLMVDGPEPFQSTSVAIPRVWNTWPAAPEVQVPHWLRCQTVCCAAQVTRCDCTSALAESVESSMTLALANTRCCHLPHHLLRFGDARKDAKAPFFLQKMLASCYSMTAAPSGRHGFPPFRNACPAAAEVQVASCLYCETANCAPPVTRCDCTSASV